MTATLLALALIVVGALTTRSVWLLGFRAGVALEQARGAMERGAAMMEQALADIEARRAAVGLRNSDYGDRS
jgi:hypothetical protein